MSTTILYPPIPLRRIETLAPSIQGLRDMACDAGGGSATCDRNVAKRRKSSLLSQRKKMMNERAREHGFCVYVNGMNILPDIGQGQRKSTRRSHSAWPQSDVDIRCRDGRRITVKPAVALKQEIPPAYPRMCPIEPLRIQISEKLRQAREMRRTVRELTT